MESKDVLFASLLRNLHEQHSSVIDEYKYIGTGNPLSDILIIGKEAAISTESEQYKREIVENFNFWNNLKEYTQHDCVNHSYSPLYPYKGQVLKKDNGMNCGTSVTWMNYQKLFNHIYKPTVNDAINFHEKSFITEVNSTPSKKTVEANTCSISFRKKNILSSDFFQSFSVVIISGVGYLDITDQNNEIEQIFQVKFSTQKFAKGNRQPYWIHWNEAKTNLVINTYQLSIGVADELLHEVAEEIRNSGLVNLDI